MTLPFCEEVINDGEINSYNFTYPNFVGYLNPKGEPISFSDKLGYTGHGEAPSIQEKFRVFYILKIENYKYISILEKHIMSDEYQHSQKERYLKLLKEANSSLKEDIERFKKRSSCCFIREQMELDIYNFLINCYSAHTFFDGIGNVETCMCEYKYWEQEYKHNKLYDASHWDFKMDYSIYKDKILADIFKQVMIQYVGYHSVERIPRTITTSNPKIYETFWNYLLHDFNIVQLPRMIFDPNKKMYIERPVNEFFIPDSELRLKAALQSVKKLVPLDERYKYHM